MGANKKFKFPTKKEKIEEKDPPSEAPILSKEKDEERSVSVRKRMEDEMRKEVKVEKAEKQESDQDFKSVTMSEVDDSNQMSCEEKIRKADKLNRKERQYRVSKDERQKERDEKERKR